MNWELIDKEMIEHTTGEFDEREHRVEFLRWCAENGVVSADDGFEYLFREPYNSASALYILLLENAIREYLKGYH